MKKYILIVAIALIVGGCSSLISVGDGNTNSYNDNKSLNYKKD